MEPTLKTNAYERGTYYFFDCLNWRKVAKVRFCLCIPYNGIPTQSLKSEARPAPLINEDDGFYINVGGWDVGGERCQEFGEYKYCLSEFTWSSCMALSTLVY